MSVFCIGIYAVMQACLSSRISWKTLKTGDRLVVTDNEKEEKDRVVKIQNKEHEKKQRARKEREREKWTRKIRTRSPPRKRKATEQHDKVKNEQSDSHFNTCGI